MKSFTNRCFVRIDVPFKLNFFYCPNTSAPRKVSAKPYHRVKTCCGRLAYFRYYHRWRTHLSLDKDAPESRPVQDLQAGRIIQIREVGGLHHRYERRAA